jgi:hypothetical protein
VEDARAKTSINKHVTDLWQCCLRDEPFPDFGDLCWALVHEVLCDTLRSGTPCTSHVIVRCFMRLGLIEDATNLSDPRLFGIFCHVILREYVEESAVFQALGSAAAKRAHWDGVVAWAGLPANSEAYCLLVHSIVYAKAGHAYTASAYAYRRL